MAYEGLRGFIAISSLLPMAKVLIVTVRPDSNNRIFVLVVQNRIPG